MDTLKKNIVLPKKINLDKNSCYEVLGFLGQGSYATVFRARNIKNGQPEQTVAIKMILLKKNNINSNKIEQNLKSLTQREADIMYELRSHRNIVQIYNHFQDDNHVYFVLEFCINKTLTGLIKNGQITLSKSLIKKLIFDISTGCQYMHLNMIIHRDIKPDNILLGENFLAKIGDFGLAIHVDSKKELLYKFCGTPKYQAPEMLQRKGYNFPVDIWAIGCIVYRLFYGNTPFDGHNAKDIFKSVLCKKVNCSRVSRYNFSMSNEEIKVIKLLLTKEPSKRLKIEDLLGREEFFQEKYDDNEWSKVNSMDIAMNQVQFKYENMISYLKAIIDYDPNKRIRINYQPYHDCKLVPNYWIRQWIEINIFGFGYYFGSTIFAFNFKDKSKMLRQKKLIFYLDGKKNNQSICQFEDNECPEELKKKLRILQQAFDVLQRSGFNNDYNNIHNHNDDGDDDNENNNNNNDNKVLMKNNKNLNQNEIPWLNKWIKTIDVMVFQMDTKLIQINFGQQKKNLLFDPENNSMSIVNLVKNKSLSLGLKFILNGKVTEKMQQYISVALQYIELLNKSKTNFGK